MSYLMQLSQLVNATNGELINGDCTFNNLSTDTRKVVEGDVFLALSGETFDGHDFCQQAIEKGAIALVVERALDFKVPQLVVTNCHRALGKIAQFNRQQYTGSVIAVTGSNGKTTTKELIASILSVKGKTLATIGNLNNEIGVPLTLLRYNGSQEYSVIEMGANAKGEIGYCTELTHPSVAMITNAMGAHLEGFGSLQGVVEAKGEIFDGLDDQGIAVLNLDDINVHQWQAKLQGKKVIYFSLNNQTADVYATETKQLENGNYQFRLHLDGQNSLVTLQLLALHNVKNALAAAAAVFAIGGSLLEIVEGLEKATAVDGRLKQLNGFRNATLIDDSYNGNPDSVKAGIDFLSNLSGKKILALGDMAELGVGDLSLHQSVGSHAAIKKLDYLFSCGPKGKLAAIEFSAKSGAPLMAFENREQLVAAIKKIMNRECKILIKGSLSAGMAKVVKELEYKPDVSEEGGQ